MGSGGRGAGGKVCPSPANFLHECFHKSMRAAGWSSTARRSVSFRPRWVPRKSQPRRAPSGQSPAVAGGAHCCPGGLRAAGPRRGCRTAERRGCILLRACRSVVRPRRLLPPGLSSAPPPRALASRRFLARVRAQPAFPRPGRPRPLPLRPRRPRPPRSSGEPFPGGAGRTRNSARPESGSPASLGGGFSGDKEPGERIR